MRFGLALAVLLLAACQPPTEREAKPATAVAEAAAIAQPAVQSPPEPPADGGPAPAVASTAPAIAEDAPYAEARAKLIAEGFSPLAQPRTGDEIFCGADGGEADLCLLYPEVQDCAGSGVRPCLFIFERRADGRHLEVATYGELTSEVRVKRVAWAAGE